MALVTQRPLAPTPERIAELLAQLPPAAAPADACDRLAAELRREDGVVVAIDDDPTGSQTVAGVPLLLRFDDDDLAWALASGSDVVFALTNARALGEAEAVAVTRPLAERLALAARRRGALLHAISRGDSTLRGHFPPRSTRSPTGFRTPARRRSTRTLAPAAGVERKAAIAAAVVERVLAAAPPAFLLAQGLAGVASVSLPAYDPADECVFHMVTLNVDEQAAGVSRDTYLKALQAEGVPAVGYVENGLHRSPRLSPDYPGPRTMWTDLIRRSGANPNATELPGCDAKVARSIELPWNYHEVDEALIGGIAGAFQKLEQNLEELRALDRR